uniref:Uncharacterized protein n=1 Tax=Panagrolaimus davidi TaxID=227884 RepID=A0A914P8G3_9BILA
MDLTFALKENPPSNGESNGAENNGMNVRNSKRAKFMATYRHQNFSIPDSVIFYIAKNPKTAELYQKMIKTCKYFFIKNPIIVIDKPLNYDNSQWTIVQTPYDMNQTTSKLWTADDLNVSPKYSITTETKDQNILTSIIPNLYRWIYFDEVVVKHEDGSNVEVQKIVEIVSYATSIDISHPTITSKTMEELLKIPNFPTLQDFTLYNIPEVFDIEAFYVHMKKNKTTSFYFFFDESISDEYMKRLDEITDEIIATKEFDYKPAFIHFRGLDYERHKKLDDIFSEINL